MRVRSLDIGLTLPGPTSAVKGRQGMHWSAKPDTGGPCAGLKRFAHGKLSRACGRADIGARCPCSIQSASMYQKLVQVAGDCCCARPVTQQALQPNSKCSLSGRQMVCRLLLEACVVAKHVYWHVVVQAKG